jgi:prepilin peptidase CpaA
MPEESFVTWIAEYSATTSFVLACTVAGIAAVTDLRSRTIPNALTYPAIALGFIIAAVQGTLPSALVGFGIAAACAYALYCCASMGGGDVKLLAALGMLVGYPLILDLLFFGVVFGAAWTMFVLLMRGTLLRTFAEIWRLAKSLIYPKVPMFVPAQGVHIAGGAILALATFWIIVPIMFGGMAGT